jgi:hypothetical protein
MLREIEKHETEVVEVRQRVRAGGSPPTG